MYLYLVPVPRTYLVHVLVPIPRTRTCTLYLVPVHVSSLGVDVQTGLRLTVDYFFDLRLTVDFGFGLSTDCPSLGVDSRLFSNSRLFRAIFQNSRLLVDIQNESRLLVDIQIQSRQLVDIQNSKSTVSRNHRKWRDSRLSKC